MPAVASPEMPAKTFAPAPRKGSHHAAAAAPKAARAAVRCPGSVARSHSGSRMAANSLVATMHPRTAIDAAGLRIVINSRETVSSSAGTIS